MLAVRTLEVIMRKSRYSEHQIVGALKQAEAGTPVKDICRELGVSQATPFGSRSTSQVPG